MVFYEGREVPRLGWLCGYGKGLLFRDDNIRKQSSDPRHYDVYLMFEMTPLQLVPTIRFIWIIGQRSTWSATKIVDSYSLVR